MKVLAIILPLFFYGFCQSQIDSESYLKFGKEDFELGFYLSAVEKLNQAILLDSSNSDAYYYRGLCYKNAFRADFPNICIKDFAKCIELDSTKNYSEAYLFLGRSLIFFSNSFKVRYPSIALISESPEITAHHHLIKAYQLDTSIEMAEQITKLYNPISMGCYALEFINLALEKFPSNYNLNKHKAQVLMFMYDYDSAIDEYKKLIEMHKKDGELYNNILICMAQKRYLQEKEIDMKFYCKMIKKAKRYYNTESNYQYCEECWEVANSHKKRYSN